MQKVKLSEITTYITDGEHGSVHDTKSNLYLLSNKNIVDGRVFISDNERTISKNDFIRIMNRIKIRRNSILISTVGQIGKIAIIDNDEINFVFQRSVGIINIDESKANPYYVYLYLQLPSVQKYINFKSKGSIQKCLFIEDMGDLEIYLPSLKEQNQIANNIKPMEIKTILNNKINSELESLAKTIYDYWFLQFDFPNEEGKPYKSSGGAMEYNEELKMDIPKGWEVKKIKDIVDFVPGYAFSTQDYIDDGKYKLYTIKNVQDGKIDPITDNRIKYLPSNMPKDCLLNKGDILLSLTGNVGRVGLVYEENVLLNQRVLKIVPKNNDFAYIYMLFRNRSMQKKMEHISTGTSQKNLSPEDMKEIFVLCPQNALVKKYSNTCNLLIEMMIQNQAENLELSSLRDYLLPLLMNGQVGFKDD